MQKLCLVFLFLFSNAVFAFAQNAHIKGKVFNRVNNDPVPFANIIVQGTAKGTTSDINGIYEIGDLQPGVYNLEVKYVGFKPALQFDIEVTNARSAIINIGLLEDSKTLEDVIVIASNFDKTDESPLSLRTLSATEIKRSPGGNRDISRVIRSLPGVASTPSFRNDIIIRGGSPGENRFYLDGIEVPTINHFQTQGASGGPVGLINVDLIQKVDFYSGAFPANRGNALSSVFEFTQKDGRNDKATANLIMGASDVGITLEGPIQENTTYLLSARRSYLQYLFSILGLPFLPTYNDFQAKVKHKFNKNHQLTILGIGAIDQFTLNEGAADQASSPEERDEINYILNQLPVNNQWNYAFGAKYEYFHKTGHITLVASRNALNNTAVKFANNDDSNPDNLLIDFQSRETENKFRFEDYRITETDFRINYGINYEYAHFFVNEFSRFANNFGPLQNDYVSDLYMNKWGLFAQVSKPFFDEKLMLSLGFRSDANDFNDEMRRLVEQFSPRFSASWNFAPSWSFNFNTGIYYQLPPYPLLGFRDSENGELVNRRNGVTYIRNRQIVGGFEYNANSNTKFTLESFYKQYSQYPFMLTDSISLANLGADFGVIGNAPATSTSEGRSYGIEFMAQQRLFKGFYGIAAFTWVRSAFEDKNGNLIPSAWDNRHLVSLTGGKKFKKDWEIGMRWLYSGAAPYTPYSLMETTRRSNWDVFGRGIPDFSRINDGRTSPFHQLDLRIDKKYFFNNWSLNVFLDIQNIYNHETNLRPFMDVVRDETGVPVISPDNADFYLPRLLRNTNGTILPTVGIIIEL
ncbi:MAG: TonB-dependent receptor [Cyclobacteriaceae bacterium]|nr:TonB-dependent receptor [Cyclobacteriaceae bacterium]